MMSCGFGMTLLLLTSALAMHAHATKSRKDYLDFHNAVRAEVGLGPVTWDTKLERYAKHYAGVRAKDCALIHSQGPYGENIYYGGGIGYESAVDAMKWWYKEKRYYDHATNRCLNNVGCLHYTQMIWRDSTRIGCARVRCRNGDYFTTCNYGPPGNVEGERPY